MLSVHSVTTGIRARPVTSSNSWIILLAHWTRLFKKIGNKNPVSVDITGGEPTLDHRFLAKVFKKLREYNVKSKVLRVTMTTNGTYLREVIPDMKDVVDYVNISIHGWRPLRREEILGVLYRWY